MDPQGFKQEIAPLDRASFILVDTHVLCFHIPKAVHLTKKAWLILKRQRNFPFASACGGGA